MTSMESYYVMLGLVALFLAISAVIGMRDSRRQDEREKKRLLSAFGKRGNKEYPDGRFAQIPKYTQRHPGSFMIDDITWNDLDMDSLFRSMDTTCSSAGEEYLYRLLRAPRMDGQIACSDPGMKWWAEHETERVRVQRLLQIPGRSGKYSIYDYLNLMEDLPARSPVRDLPAVILPLISFVILFFNPPVGICCLLASFAFNMITYFKVKGRIDPYLFTFRYILRLLECADRISKEDFPNYDEEKGVMRSVYHSFKGFIRGSGILLRGSSGPASGNPIDLLLDYLCILFHIDLFKFGSMLGDLRGRKKEIDDLITAIGSVDAGISIASWRESLPFYCVPDLGGRDYEVTDLIHPLLENPVPNCIQTGRPVLLTGSNASGKSTFLKAAALAALLAQSVGSVPARSYKGPCFRIFTSMALRDDIESGESYFIVEIRSLKRILDAASDSSGLPVLCCVDEVLRGTNTIERISASAEILDHLADTGIQVFAATHDIELTELLKDKYSNYHFSETMSGDDVRFSYKLLEGPADSRNAIRLLRALGYDPRIADRAEERAGRFLETGRWEM